MTTSTTTAFTKSSDYSRYNNSTKPVYSTRRSSRTDYYNSVSKVDIENTITLEHNIKDVESTLCKLMDSEIERIGFDYYQCAFEAELLNNRYYSNSRIRYNNAANSKAYSNEIMAQKYGTMKMKQNSIDLIHHSNGQQQTSAAPLSTLPSSNGIHTYTLTDTNTSNTPTPYYYHSPVQSTHNMNNSSLHSSPVGSYNGNCNDTHAMQQKSASRSSNRNGQYNKKSIKMSVPSSKRQILEEEFRKEKYPSNEKLQKLSSKLNMRYDEVQNYFKKRRREEKEGNLKFTNLVKLLNVYLEQEN